MARRPSDGASVLLRIDPALRLFVAPTRRAAHVEAHATTSATVGHVVQSIGVPLTEVGALLAGGADLPASTPLGDLPQPGIAIDVVPMGRPQATPTAAPRFVLDVHLGRLARQLRVLGLDVLYDRDADDAELTVVAAAQHRVLLTQDRGLLKRQHLPRRGRAAPDAPVGRPAWVAAFVRGTTTAQQRVDVLDRFAPALAPWTRCPRCNGVLVHVGKDAVASELEPGTRRQFDEFARCPACGQVYWHGAHSRRLDQIVSASIEQVTLARRSPRPRGN